MALINPSNLYSEGQVNLDSTPYLRMQQQQQAKKQAREDALYKYYSELPTKINGAGMRVQDIDGANGGFNKKIQDIRTFWDTNKQDIIRGGRAAQAYQQLVNDAKQYAEQSKKTAQFQLKFGQDFFQGKHKPRENDLNIIAAIDKPIDDDSHYKDKDIRMPYGYNDFSIAAPDFDANKEIAFDKAILGGAEPQILLTEKPKYDTNTYEVIYNKKYRPEDIYAAAERAAGEIKGNKPAYNRFYDALFDKDEVKKASEALSKLSGTTVIAETPEQMAAGLKAAQFMDFSKEDRRKDVNAVNRFKEKQKWLDFDIWKKKQPIKLANEKEMAATRDYYKNKSEEEVVKDVSAFVEGEIEYAKNNPVPLGAERPLDKDKKRLEGGTQYLSPYKLRTSPATLALFSQKDVLNFIHTPKDIYFNPENGNMILKGGEPDGGDREITRKEYESVLVNKVFNTKVKLNQIETDRQVDGDKKKTEIKSSSKKSKWSSFAVPNK
jgi:hypothetical protein